MKRFVLIGIMTVVMALLGTTAQAATGAAARTAATSASAATPSVVVIPVDPKVNPGGAHTDATPYCGRFGGTIRCGIKHTNLESRLIVGAALGALGAGGAVACSRNPICLVLVGAGIGVALAWWNAVANEGKCIFYSTFPRQYLALISC